MIVNFSILKLIINLIIDLQPREACSREIGYHPGSPVRSSCTRWPLPSSIRSNYNKEKKVSQLGACFPKPFKLKCPANSGSLSNNTNIRVQSIRIRTGSGFRISDPDPGSLIRIPDLGFRILNPVPAYCSINLNHTISIYCTVAMCRCNKPGKFDYTLQNYGKIFCTRQV